MITRKSVFQLFMAFSLACGRCLRVVCSRGGGGEYVWHKLPYGEGWSRAGEGRVGGAFRHD